jgi:hypothetical protein
MRTRKHFIAMAFIAIITLAIIGCKQDEPPPPQPQSYGTLPNGVGIYKGEGVTDAEMTTAVQAAIDGYNAAVAAGKNPIGKFTKLVILGHDGTVYTWDGNVLGVSVEANASFFQSIFSGIADGSLSQT